jgi:hypothetical protein
MAASALLAAAFISTGSGGPAPSLRQDVVIDHDRLFLGDVADLSLLPTGLRARARLIEIARGPHGRTEGSVTDTWLVARARAQMPVLAYWLPEAKGVAIRVTYRSSRQNGGERGAPVSGRRCLVVVEPLRAGESPVPGKFEKAACTTGSVARTFRYDASSQSVRTIRSIDAGEIVPAFAGYDVDAVRRGDQITLVTIAGPVRVERTVEALQSAYKGQKLFARSQDGDVFPVRYPGRGQ